MNENDFCQCKICCEQHKEFERLIRLQNQKIRERNDKRKQEENVWRKALKSLNDNGICTANKND